MVELILLAIVCFVVCFIFFAFGCGILSGPEKRTRAVDMETGLPWSGTGTFLVVDDE